MTSEERTQALPVYVAYNEGVFWNVTHDEEYAKDWLERGVIECYQKFLPDGDLVMGDAK